MKFLSLFSGIGGFDDGLEAAGMTCVGQVEIDPFCRHVLAYHRPHVKRMEDIHNANGNEFGHIDLICGGVPCQPASSAGKRRGKLDDRWLWPEAFRIVRNVRPDWCLFENVRGITSLESGVVFDDLLSELESCGAEQEGSGGYEVAPPLIIPACAVDAPHRRDRVWIVARRRDAVADADSQREQQCGGVKSKGRERVGDSGETLAHADCSGLGERWRPEPIQQEHTAAECGGEDVPYPLGQYDDRGGYGTGPIRGERSETAGVSGRHAASDSPQLGRREGLSDSRRGGEGTIAPIERAGSSDRCRWLPESGIRRVSNGVPNRVHRLRALGNAVVPQVVEKIGRAIMLAHLQYRGTL